MARTELSANLDLYVSPAGSDTMFPGNVNGTKTLGGECG